MRLDESLESNPAEFLFGRIATNILNSPSQTQFVQKNSKRLDFLTNFIILLQISLVFLALFIYFSGISYSLWSMIGIGANIWILASIKTASYMKKYAPDLMKAHLKLNRFYFIQSFIAHLAFFVFSGLMYFVIMLINGSNSVTTALTIVLATGLYIRYFSDLGVVTVVTGIGLIPSWGGIRRMSHNFRKLIEIRGRHSTHLAFLKLGSILGIIYTSVNNFPLFIQLAWIGVYFYYHRRWERVNISSLIVTARTFVHAQSPAVLPTKILEISTSPGKMDDTTEEGLQSTEQELANEINYRERLFGKQYRQNKRQVNQVGQLGTIAARSINRIADKIRKEQKQVLDQLNMNHCLDCGIEVNLGAKYCYECSQYMTS